MNTRRKREVKKIGQEYIRDHRGSGIAGSVQAAVDDLRANHHMRGLKAGSMIISGGAIMTSEEYEHRAWLQEITDRVNRRLGNK